MAASRAHRGELGEAWDLDTPGLVVREMEVQDVELVPGNEVDRAQHQGLRLEVAGDVEHEPAVAEAGSVHDPDRREVEPTAPAGRRRGQEAPQGLEAVEDAGGRDAHDTYALDEIHDERVRLGRCLTCHGAHVES